jgi:cephalosporin hydroxylase
VTSSLTRAPLIVSRTPDPADAFWRQRSRIRAARERLGRLAAAVDRPDDLEFSQWVQLYALVFDYAPDLIVELGRGSGSATCVLVQAANELMCTRVVSIDDDQDRSWATQTVARLEGLVSAEWFGNLEVIHAGIPEVDFDAVVGTSRRVLVYWKKHDEYATEFILRECMRVLRPRDHMVLVRDITDARYNDVNPSYVLADTANLRWLGHLVTPYDDIAQLYDFLSRNKIVIHTASHAWAEALKVHPERLDALEQEIGSNLARDASLHNAHWIYFDQSHTWRSTWDIAYPPPPVSAADRPLNLGAALWTHRDKLVRAKDVFSELHHSIQGPEDFHLASWFQLYALVLDFRPDLIVELGRGYGNSTCVFLQAANQLGNAQVVSIGYYDDFAWRDNTLPRVQELLPGTWLDRLDARYEDIRTTDFRSIFSGGGRILLFWDAHGLDLGHYLLANAFPLLEAKQHLIVVDDVTDARYNDRDPEYDARGGTPTIWIGDLISIFDEIIPLADFLSRNRLHFNSPEASINTWSLKHQKQRRELDQMFGPALCQPSVTEAGAWIYFDLSKGSTEFATYPGRMESRRPNVYPPYLRGEGEVLAQNLTLREELDAAKAELARARDELAQARELEDQLHLTNESAKGELQQRADALREANHRVGELQADLDRIRSTRAWRLYTRLQRTRRYLGLAK